MPASKSDLRSIAEQIVSGAKNIRGSEYIDLARAWLADNPGTRDPDNLTMRQQEIFDMIRDRHRARMSAPTVREIGTQFGIKSPNGVMCHIHAMERKGVLRRNAGLSRGIEVVEEYR